MFFRRRPSPDRIQSLIREHESVPFTYREVGATNHTPPPGYIIDHNRQLLGKGESVYHSAILALQQWKHFDIDWLKVCKTTNPIEIGQIFGVLAPVMGLWSWTPCRITHHVQEAGDIEARGFAWGTLPGHVLKGEESFVVEWNHQTDEVYYDVLAFSLPMHWLAHLGYYFQRSLQKRFARDSKAAMLRAVQS